MEYSQLYYNSIIWQPMVDKPREHSIMYRKDEILCFTPETNAALCVNYTQVKQFKETNNQNRLVNNMYNVILFY